MSRPLPTHFCKLPLQTRPPVGRSGAARRRVRAFIPGGDNSVGWDKAQKMRNKAYLPHRPWPPLIINRHKGKQRFCYLFPRANPAPAHPGLSLNAH